MHPYRLPFSAEGNCLALAGKRCALQLFEFSSGRLVANLEANRLFRLDDDRLVDDDFSDELLLYMQTHGETETDQTRYFKPRTGQSMPVPGGFPYVDRRSADWRHVFAWRPKKDAGFDWAVWNVRSGLIEWEFSSAGHAIFSDNGTHMVVFDETENGAANAAKWDPLLRPESSANGTRRTRLRRVADPFGQRRAP